jgi:hypothetical protein
MEIDVTEELKELLKTYEEALKKLEQRFQTSLSTITYAMRQHLDVHDQKVKMAQKIFDLQKKLTPPEKCTCGCEDPEEDDDE